MKWIRIFVLMVTTLSYAQKDSLFYENIRNIGESYVKDLKEGEIDNLKDAKPPKGTWNYQDLINYKETLTNNKSAIYYGSFVEESKAKKGLYAYNFFAFQKQKEPYFFVAVVSIDTNNNKFVTESAFLFTEKDVLISWWQHTYGFYKIEAIKIIPKKYLYESCPPPPFREK